MKNNIPAIIGGILVIGFVFWISTSERKPAELDGFTSCLADKGLVFYGAFWCSHCANQKALFGRSVKLLPYVECSTADAKSQLAICKDKNISSYPTWEIPALGEATTTSRLTGEISLEQLSKVSGCPLPNSTASVE